MESDRCCDYCPTSHTWACLSRHTADERAAALRHQATHDTTGDEQSSSAAPVEPPHEPSAVESTHARCRINYACAWLRRRPR